MKMDIMDDFMNEQITQLSLLCVVKFLPVYTTNTNEQSHTHNTPFKK